MTTTPHTWTGTAAAALARCAERPLLLFLFLWTLNGLARPYAGFIHDARLYAVQVLNQIEPGAYADDLFLRFGSQDQFSLFSRVVAPLASFVGLETAFFVLYLASNALFLFAVMRLVLALIANRRGAVASLIVLAVAPMPFGGLNIFHVHETFLTPRILANAFTLFALEQVLRQRFGSAAFLLLGATALHPLMAFGGWLVWLGCLAVRSLSWKTLTWTVTVVGLTGTAILVNEVWGTALFGVMDEEWRDMVRRASAYNFPDEWTLRDWLGVVGSLAIVATAGVELRSAQPWPARCCLVAAAVGFLGLLGTVLGSYLPYALLFQGQPYRALWILAAMQIPLGIWLAARWLGAGAKPQAALTILLYLGLTNFDLWEIAFPLFLLPMFALAYRGLEPMPKHADWLPRAGLLSLALGFVGWALYKWYIIWVHRDTIAANIDALEIGRLLLDHVGPTGWLLLSAYVVARVGRPRWRWLAAPALAVIVNVVFFALPLHHAYRAHYTRDYADVDFVRDFLEQRHSRQPLTIYSALGRADYVWVDLRAKSYYDWAQVVGVLFNRQTALEGSRRALLVSRFEMQRLQNDPLAADSFKPIAERLYQTSWDAPEPTWAEFARLCREDLDIAVLKQEFPGLVEATNGRVFIYDCRKVLRALQPHPADPWALSWDKRDEDFDYLGCLAYRKYTERFSQEKEPSP